MADTRKRIQIDLPLIKKLLLFLWAESRDTTRTTMAARILVDRVSDEKNRAEAIRDLKIKAAFRKMSLKEYVVSLLKADLEFSQLPLDDLDIDSLIEVEETDFVKAAIALLELGEVESTIALLKEKL